MCRWRRWQATKALRRRPCPCALKRRLVTISPTTRCKPCISTRRLAHTWPSRQGGGALPGRGAACHEGPRDRRRPRGGGHAGWPEHAELRKAAVPAIERVRRVRCAAPAATQAPAGVTIPAPSGGWANVGQYITSDQCTGWASAMSSANSYVSGGGRRVGAGGAGACEAPRRSAWCVGSPPAPHPLPHDRPTPPPRASRQQPCPPQSTQTTWGSSRAGARARQACLRTSWPYCVGGAVPSGGSPGCARRKGTGRPLPQRLRLVSPQCWADAGQLG